MQTAVNETRVETDFRAAETPKSCLEAAVGNTPLIHLRQIVKGLPRKIEIYAKAEHLNPGGSVKDRAALAMILAGEKSGALTKDKIILDATSGNTGIAYAMIGAARGLKEYNPNLRAISMQPDSPLHGLEGMKHLATAIVPGIYAADLADENVEVTTEDAQEMTRRLAKEEGMFVGISAGANVFAAIRLAKTLKNDAVIVTVLCDGGGKYLSEKFWDEH